jgi:hypothetical protein
VHELHATSRFLTQLDAAPPRVQKAVTKQLDLLRAHGLRYPSLGAEKHDAARKIWWLRATLDWRFYLQDTGDTFLLLSLFHHPK